MSSSNTTGADYKVTEAPILREDIKDVYICVYFDGTSNNMYFPENKRKKLRSQDNENWALQAEQASHIHKIDTNREDKHSNGNDKYSNVALLYSLAKNYNHEKEMLQSSDPLSNNPAVGYSIYIEGAGAKPIDGSSIAGSGFGVDITGVVALVSKAVKLVYEYLASVVACSIRSDVKLHFALYGFSRGSTCARLFAHLITRGNKAPTLPREKEFGSYLKNDRLYKYDRVCFLEDFRDNNIKVDFLGIYDTVSSIGFLQRDENKTNAGLNSFSEVNSSRTDLFENFKMGHAEKYLSPIFPIVNKVRPIVDSIPNELSTIVPALGGAKYYIDKMSDFSNELNNWKIERSKDKDYVNNLHILGGKLWGDAYENYHRDNVTDYGLYSPFNDRVEHTFQIGALDEFRENFAFVNLGRHLNSRCAELFVPGCHSDIGGGYMEEDILVHYCLRKSICEVPTKIIIGCPGFKPKCANDVVSVSVEGLDIAGWYIEEKKDLLKKMADTLKGKQGSLSDREQNIDFKRYVAEGYSNITLRAMIERVKSKKLGLGSWPSEFQPFDETSRHVRFEIPSDLKGFGDKIVKRAIELETGRDWVVPASKEEYRLLRKKYIHFTSTDRRYPGLSGNPMKIGERLKSWGANLGNPPYWKLENIGGEKCYLLCRLMYNGDKGDRSLATLYDLKENG